MVGGVGVVVGGVGVVAGGFVVLGAREPANAGVSGIVRHRPKIKGPKNLRTGCPPED